MVARIHDALPQTQCTRCGYPSCHDYALAICDGQAINRCPPGGAQGITKLADITGRPALPLDPACGAEGPRRVAFVVEAQCIGCTLCIKACPVDCIVGAPKRMHTVIEAECTGCVLCIPACPVDCIELEVVTPGRSGWQAWSAADALIARQRFEARDQRRARLAAQNDEHLAAKAKHKLDDLAAASTLSDDAVLARKRALIEAAISRAHERLAGKDTPSDGKMPR